MLKVLILGIVDGVQDHSLETRFQLVVENILHNDIGLIIEFLPIEVSHILENLLREQSLRLSLIQLDQP